MMDPDELEQLTGAWETYQQEVDRRFDRLAKRIMVLEDTAAQLRKDREEDFERINRKLAEAELAIRKYFAELLDPLQAALHTQTQTMERVQAMIDVQTVGNFWQGGI